MSHAWINSQEANRNTMSLDMEQNRLYDWSQLPELVMESVFSFMDSRNLTQISLVCKRWSSIFFSTPSAWKSVYFYITTEDDVKNEPEEVRCTKELGKYFRHVHIELKEPCMVNLVRPRRLKPLIDSLTQHSTISTFSLVAWDSYFGTVSSENIECLMQSIRTLLRSQKQLKSIELTNCNFKAHYAEILLRTICEEHVGKLIKLKLDRYVEWRWNWDRFKNKIPSSSLYELLLKLTELTVDTSLESTAILHTFCKYVESRRLQNEKGMLQTLKITCYEIDWSVNLCSWRTIREVFPLINIDFAYKLKCFDKDSLIYDFPYTKLRSLDFESIDPNTGDSQLDYFLETIKNTELLEVLKIAWPTDATNMDKKLIPVLQRCPKLRVLSLQFRYNIPALDAVSHHCKMESVNLSVESLSE